MATQVQNRRGTTAEHSTFTGAVAELTVDTDKDVVVVHDGSTAGGHPMLKQDGSNSALALGSAASPSLKFSGDPNTGIYSPGADQVAISTNGTGRLFIDSSGRVGLGTSAPAVNLEVYGAQGTLLEALRLRNQNAGVAGVRQTFWQDYLVAGFTASRNGLDGRLSLQTTDTSGNLQDRLYIDGSGRVGIGTASPGAKLDVSGSGGTTCRVIDSSSYAELALTGGGTVNYITSDDALATYIGGTERARIDSSGRLLVGTSSTSGIGNLQDRKNSSGSATGVMEIGTSDGYASISSGNTIGILRFTEATNSGLFAQIYAEADAAVGNNDYPGRLVFSTTADGASSPTERGKFGSDGYIYCYQSYTGTTAIAANLVVLSNGAFLRSSSSAKYKTQIEDLQDQYADALLQCRPVWYRSTCQADNPNHGWWGFIAEEVAAIDPRLVHWKTVEITYDEKGSAVETPCDPEPEGVAYDRFVPHLLNLIKRQKEQIEAMDARLSALEAS